MTYDQRGAEIVATPRFVGVIAMSAGGRVVDPASFNTYLGSDPDPIELGRDIRAALAAGRLLSSHAEMMAQFQPDKVKADIREWQETMRDLHGYRSIREMQRPMFHAVVDETADELVLTPMRQISNGWTGIRGSQPFGVSRGVSDHDLGQAAKRVLTMCESVYAEG